MRPHILDCTLRDGGFYNNWDFEADFINDYLLAIHSVNVTVAEIGYRSTKNHGFKGPCAYSRDDFLRSLRIPRGLQLGVMINAADLDSGSDPEPVLQELFPKSPGPSPVRLVRVACHFHEILKALPVSSWLADRGFQVGLNLMQASRISPEDLRQVAREVQKWPVDIFYLADSTGSLKPREVGELFRNLRRSYRGAMGIHAHDNLGLALSNSLRALEEGVTWIDSTVGGMGRGPGNARTEELFIELGLKKKTRTNLVPLMSLLRGKIRSMQVQYGWGSNIFYYLAGKFGIHPTYIQEMLSDPRYEEVDVLAVIEHLSKKGGAKFSRTNLKLARHFYPSLPQGTWCPREKFSGRKVLLLGAGPSVNRHREALERYIREAKPIVVALNTQKSIEGGLIQFRVACHPVRLLADCAAHLSLPQPLITPFSMLPQKTRNSFRGKKILDFGLKIQPGEFEFGETFCRIPTDLALAYALATVTSGEATQVWMAGFDGYEGEDPRNSEIESLLETYQQTAGALPLTSITPTRYGMPTESVYAL